MTTGDFKEEMDFSELFLCNSPEEFPISYEKDETGPFLRDDNHQLLLMDNHTPSISQQLGSMQEISSHSNTEHLSETAYDSLGLESNPGPIRTPSPRIEITPSGDSYSSTTLESVPGCKVLGTYRECVSPASSNSSTGWPVDAYSPVASPTPTTGFAMGLSGLDLCPALQGIHTSSAHSSPGTSHRNSITEESFLQPQYLRTMSSVPHQRSRSAPPHGKRSHGQPHSCQGGTPVKQRSRSPSPSPIPWPQGQQGSYYLHQYQSQAQACSPGLQSPTQTLVARDSHWQAKREDCAYEEAFQLTTEQEKMDRVKTDRSEVKSDTFYVLPTVWSPLPPLHHRGFSGLPLASFPSLEWPIPSKSGQYELFIQQQPRSHHRAHYETEGSRGAVKTPNGGHPEVQLRGYQGAAQLGLQVYIGTADEKLLKPHSFYQVHRITGKTVTTPSMERMVNGTKVLEIPMEPKNNMRVIIDCVGILKLRNADIELKSNETDIGRKNTRVRLVFRVHIPQSGGQLLSLQVASDPIECSQRSAQELPSVERQDLDRCSVLGGQQMVLTGQNFTSDSKVVFSEKTQAKTPPHIFTCARFMKKAIGPIPLNLHDNLFLCFSDGKQIWEVEATVDRDKTQANMLFVEIPPYRDRCISHPAKVNFFVINGKKKRSQPQHLLYMPVIAIKTEPLDESQLMSYSYSENQSLPSMSMKSLYQHLDRDSSCRASNVAPTSYLRTTMDPRVQVFTPDVLDDQSVYYQSSGGALIGSSMLYHTANQHYSNSGLLSGPPIALHPSSSSSQCGGTTVPHDPCLVSRYESFIQKGTPLEKSPPMRYIHHDQAQGRSRGDLEPSGQRMTQNNHYGENQEEKPSEKVTIKQENLRYAYLEDVNDIIRRDLKGHNGQ